MKAFAKYVILKKKEPMATTNHKTKIQFVNCDANPSYRAKIDELITSMERNIAPYSGTIDLEVEKRNGKVTTTNNVTSGLNDDQKRIYSSIVEMATESCESGKEPNRVKTQIEVEKEL